jgi:hypothetical protein
MNNHSSADLALIGGSPSFPPIFMTLQDLLVFPPLCAWLPIIPLESHPLWVQMPHCHTSHAGHTSHTGMSATRSCSQLRQYECQSFCRVSLVISATVIPSVTRHADTPVTRTDSCLPEYNSPPLLGASTSSLALSVRRPLIYIVWRLQHALVTMLWLLSHLGFLGPVPPSPRVRVPFLIAAAHWVSPRPFLGSRCQRSADSRARYSPSSAGLQSFQLPLRPEVSPQYLESSYSDSGVATGCQDSEVPTGCRGSEVHASCRGGEVHASCRGGEVHASCWGSEPTASCRDREVRTS